MDESEVVNWGDYRDAVSARIKDVSEHLTLQESRITNHNHLNWWLHKDPRNQPCCVCGVVTEARKLEGICDELLERISKLLNILSLH